MDRLMFATRLSALLVALHVVGMTTAMAQTVRVAVKNPSAVARPGEPVVIRWNILRHHVSALPRSVIVKDARGKLYENQVDDLDIDGVPDELTFVADFGAREEKVFAIRASPRAKSKSARMRTDAADWKRIDGVLRAIDDDDVPGAKRVRGDYRFDGVGWESELTAYRLYLDDRNAVDILGKRKPGLYWNYIGTSGVDYQMDADWGMDVLHVGSALGIGGIGFWVGDSVLKPLSVDAQRTRILARGPVRTVVSVDYTGWDKGRGKVDLKSTFFQYAGERACEHRVTLKSSGPPDTIVAGIVRHDSTSTTWDPAQGSLWTAGHQSRAGDSLMMALNVSLPQLIRETEGAYDHLILLALRNGSPVRILLSYVWQGETGRMWTTPEIEAYVRACGRRLNEPLGIRPLAH